jgi:hypothetical protein
MTASALLDTSFLITLFNETRAHHATAVQYYRHLLQHNMPMHFSAIVAAEFGIKQPITDLPLGNFRILNFNVPHGQKSAALWSALGQRDEGDSRAVIRDDVKLIAQASHEGIGFLLTDDASTLHKYCERLRAAGVIQTRALALKDGFNANLLREDGQIDWVETAPDEPEP